MTAEIGDRQPQAQEHGASRSWKRQEGSSPAASGARPCEALPAPELQAWVAAVGAKRSPEEIATGRAPPSPPRGGARLQAVSERERPSPSHLQGQRASGERTGSLKGTTLS